MVNKKTKNIKDYKLVELKGPLSYLKKFWYYIWYDDSFGSYIANFAFAYVFIKFILFPSLGLLLGTSFPIVAIVSGSMEHKIVNGEICNDRIIILFIVRMIFCHHKRCWIVYKVFPFLR